MPDSVDRVADAKDRVRVLASLALRALASVDEAARGAASRLASPFATRSDVRALRASITHLTRAVRDLGRS